MAGKTVAGTPLDPTREFAKLEIDGEVYSLVYDFNSIAQAEKDTGVNLLEGLHQLKNLNAQQLRGLLYGALRIAHPKITPEGSGRLIRFDTLGLVQDALAQAYVISMPKKNEANGHAAES